MTEGEAPEKVKRANDVRWKEHAKMAKVERKLTKRHREDTGQRPVFPEPSLPINLSEPLPNALRLRASLDRGGALGKESQGGEEVSTECRALQAATTVCPTRGRSFHMSARTKHCESG